MRNMLVILGALLGANAANGQEQLRVGKIPHVQSADLAGEACLSMVLRSQGHAVSVDQVFAAAQVDPALGRASRPFELVAAARRLGFAFPAQFGFLTCVYPDQRPDLSAPWKALVADLGRGVPSVITAALPRRRFLLVTGLDRSRDEVLVRDPTAGAERRVPRSELFAAWPFTEQGKASVFRLPLRLKAFKAPPVERGHTRAAFARHVRALKRRLPHPRFTIVVQPPFVVVGDEPAATVRRRSVGTVKWAVDRLKALYFAKDPAEILDVWLFKDARSYTRNAKRLFGEEPTTTFGYYSSADKALVMNIATGGGTLVHEIVHPFIANNFPGCPSWFNEGLASLYEQCGTKGDRIWGYTNWRLRNLQKLIRAKRLPSFETLLKTSSRAFYRDGAGDNYAQARYLCYYLQSKGLLKPFFHRFRAAHAKRTDRTGIATLKAILKEDDLAAFQTRWEAWVLRLRYR